PAVDLVIHGPAVVGTPVPIQELAAALGVPTPLGLLPEPADAVADLSPGRRSALEILPRAQQPHDEKGGLDEVAAIVLAPKGNRRGRASVDKVREDPVIASSPVQKVQHLAQPREGLIA